MNSSYKNSLSFTSDVNKINQDYHEVYKRVNIKKIKKRKTLDFRHIAVYIYVILSFNAF
jgi:hypothetical protein